MLAFIVIFVLPLSSYLQLCYEADVFIESPFYKPLHKKIGIDQIAENILYQMLPRLSIQFGSFLHSFKPILNENNYRNEISRHIKKSGIQKYHTTFLIHLYVTSIEM